MPPKRRHVVSGNVGGKSRKTDKTWNKDTSQEPGRRKSGTKPIRPCVVFLKPSPRLLSEKTDLPAAFGSFFDPAPLQQDSMLK
jgi:hypothetical protein